MHTTEAPLKLPHFARRFAERFGTNSNCSTLRKLRLNASDKFSYIHYATGFDVFVCLQGA